MGDKIWVPSLLKRLAKDTSGAFSLMWAVAMTGIIVSVGATYDLAQISKAKALAQYAADSMALTASIAVDTNNNDRFTAGQQYVYDDLGAGGLDFTSSMVGSVQYDIVDDSDTGNANLPDSDKSRLLARATVSGTYRTMFMGMMPGMSTIAFKATADVAYAARQGTPASIFFVVDNSGSMGDYDTSGTQKLASLKTSMNGFMSDMDAINTQGDEIFRTSLYPYSQDYQGYYNDIDSDGLIPSHVVSPKWGTLNNGNITQMQTRHGTDSSGALQDAADAFPFEDAIHDGENGTEEPLKFLVFMTDGANNTSYECSTQSVWVNGDPEYWTKSYWHHWWGWQTQTTYHKPWDHWNWTHHAGTAGSNQDQQVCSTDYWFDQRSLEACTQMKDAGVKIYAIAYDVAWNQKNHAEAFMQQCSSGAEYFKSADNSAALEQAFDEIGESIVTEVIRVKH